VNPIAPEANEQTVDWKTWLDGTPPRPFDPVRFFRWRCFKDYGAGLAGDLFVHLLSGIHFVTGTNVPPQRALSSGGLYYYKDGREFPDLLWTTYDYPHFQVVLHCNSNNNYQGEFFGFYGKKGSMLIYGPSTTSATLGIAGDTLTFKPQAPSDQVEDYTIFGWPEKLRKEYLDEWHKEHPGPLPGEFKIETEGEVYAAPPHYSDMADHQANFFHAVRTRKPVVENEIFGNNIAIGIYMSNYSYFHKTPAVWDAMAKRITA
jgi:predicted dehydrogenase